MKRDKVIILLILLLAGMHVYAQQPNFISEGRIEFEKKLNLYSQFNNDDSWSAEYKRRIPQFKVTYFDLFFKDNRTLFKPGKENADNNRLWEQPAENNVVYSDLEKNTAVSQKAVFEKIFLVQDSTRLIQWKITDERRNIAGFDCRRANAVIMDSIYIVAFYTDEIATIGGPESFNGLPGMILGIAVPREHVTWFATKVYLVPVKETDIQVPTKGAKITNKGMKDNLRTNLKDWGKYGERYIKAALL